MKKVVVVEDNPDNRELLRVILADLYDVTDYGTGPEALEGIPKDKPDLILLDISLPGMDGTEILETIRADADPARDPGYRPDGARHHRVIARSTWLPASTIT